MTWASCRSRPSRKTRRSPLLGFTAQLMLARATGSSHHGPFLSHCGRPCLKAHSPDFVGWANE
jgi:hypothetical protein